MTLSLFPNGKTIQSVKKNRGLINDPISDMLTRIRNATLAKKSTVSIPFTILNQEIAHVLEKEGFIQNFQVSLDSNLNNSFQSSAIIIRLKYRSKQTYRGKIKESCITNLRRISKPGLRIYANHREIPRILGGTGIVIISTTNGIITDREARALQIGGELLCSVW
jgi:small subunit ribosomal protein S8